MLSHCARIRVRNCLILQSCNCHTGLAKPAASASDDASLTSADIFARASNESCVEFVRQTSPSSAPSAPMRAEVDGVPSVGVVCVQCLQRHAEAGDSSARRCPTCRLSALQATTV